MDNAIQTTYEDCTPLIPEVWSGDGDVRTNEQMLEWAKQCGCVFEEADEMTLFIDVDSKDQLKVFWENLPLADKLFDIDKRRHKIRITDSKSGGDHKHIRIALPRLFSPTERILLQACLGSDLKRELISLKRVQNGEQNVVVFFEKEPPNG